MNVSNATLIRVHYFNVESTYLIQRSLTYNIPTLNQRINATLISVQSFQRLINVPKCNVHSHIFLSTFNERTQSNVHSRTFCQRLMNVCNTTFIRVHYVNVESTYLMQRSLTYNILTLNQRIKCNVNSRTFFSTFNQRTQIQRSFTYICSTFNESTQCNVRSCTLVKRLMNVSSATFIHVHSYQRWINVYNATLITIHS